MKNDAWKLTSLPHRKANCGMSMVWVTKYKCKIILERLKPNLLQKATHHVVDFFKESFTAYKSI